MKGQWNKTCTPHYSFFAFNILIIIILIIIRILLSFPSIYHVYPQALSLSRSKIFKSLLLLKFHCGAYDYEYNSLHYHNQSLSLSHRHSYLYIVTEGLLLFEFFLGAQELLCVTRILYNHHYQYHIAIILKGFLLFEFFIGAMKMCA